MLALHSLILCFLIVSCNVIFSDQATERLYEIALNQEVGEYNVGSSRVSIKSISKSRSSYLPQKCIEINKSGNYAGKGGFPDYEASLVDLNSISYVKRLRLNFVIENNGDFDFIPSFYDGDAVILIGEAQSRKYHTTQIRKGNFSKSVYLCLWNL